MSRPARAASDDRGGPPATARPTRVRRARGARAVRAVPLPEAVGPLVAHLSPRTRRRLAGLLPGGAVGWYRRRRADVHLLSFPKSGRTWLRVMLGRALQLHHGLPLDAGVVELHHMAERHRAVPCIMASHPGPPARARGHRRPVPTSTAFGPLAPETPVILLVRDPRDVIVSWYHHRRGRGELTYSRSLAEFLEEPESGFDALLAFYDQWVDELEARSRERPILVVRYEDLHRDPAGELRRCLDLAAAARRERGRPRRGSRDGELRVADDVVQEAVRFASFANMRWLEESDGLGTSKLRPGTPGDHTTYKTRRGEVGGFRDELDEAQAAALTHRMRASRAGHFGYE